jgi:glycosyltransferase involved in cell wall biosynthesis
MKILKVIHGYPPTYNAGSEVYSQTLCHELAQRHQVEVFTRNENILTSDYEYDQTKDPLDKRIILHCINLPRERNLLKYSHDTVNKHFASVCDRFKPDIVHIGHLNHLSIDMVDHAWQRGIPIVYTLHDYWLICPRGQFLQRNSIPPFALCDGQEDAKCASSCFRSFVSSDVATNDETNNWTNWVKQRRLRFQEICEKVDLFIAPSRYLKERFIKEFQISQHKIRYLDYGFNRSYLKNRVRTPENNFVFGYIGTHIPAKGIQDLIDAFSKLKTTKPCILKLWGRFRSDLTPILQEKIRHLSPEVSNRIQWMGEYTNNTIVQEVFNYVDAIVVPSIWVENSPLVIHEAQELRVPVITANIGGMAEYVKHEVNGLLFCPRDLEDLAKQMSILANNPEKAKQLGEKGYFYSDEGNIPDIQEHVSELESIYKELKHEKR